MTRSYDEKLYGHLLIDTPSGFSHSPHYPTAKSHEAWKISVNELTGHLLQAALDLALFLSWKTNIYLYI